ncbi:MAG: TadE/TadG family type IV pilus assembly protein [Terricaulis sp.]
MRLSCANLYLDVNTFASFTDARNNSPISNGTFNSSGFSFAPGAPSSIVVVRAYYRWKVLTPLFETLFQNVAGGERILFIHHDVPQRTVSAAMISALIRLRRFARAKSGLAALEFALLAPMMVFLLFGSVELIDALGANRRRAERRVFAGRCGLARTPK